PDTAYEEDFTVPEGKIDISSLSENQKKQLADKFLRFEIIPVWNENLNTEMFLALLKREKELKDTGREIPDTEAWGEEMDPGIIAATAEYVKKRPGSTRKRIHICEKIFTRSVINAFEKSGLFSEDVILALRKTFFFRGAEFTHTLYDFAVITEERKKKFSGFGKDIDKAFGMTSAEFRIIMRKKEEQLKFAKAADKSAEIDKLAIWEEQFQQELIKNSIPFRNAYYEDFHDALNALQKLTEIASDVYISVLTSKDEYNIDYPQFIETFLNSKFHAHSYTGRNLKEKENEYNNLALESSSAFRISECCGEFWRAFEKDDLILALTNYKKLCYESETRFRQIIDKYLKELNNKGDFRARKLLHEIHILEEKHTIKELSPDELTAGLPFFDLDPFLERAAKSIQVKKRKGKPGDITFPHSLRPYDKIITALNELPVTITMNIDYSLLPIHADKLKNDLKLWAYIILYTASKTDKIFFRFRNWERESKLDNPKRETPVVFGERYIYTFYSAVQKALLEAGEELNLDPEYVRSYIIQEFPIPVTRKLTPVPLSEETETDSTGVRETQYTQPKLTVLASHSQENLEINILALKTLNLEIFKELKQDTSYAIMECNPEPYVDENPLRIHNFTDAALFGILQAACVYAQIQDETDPEAEPALPNTINDVFPLVKRTFERVRPGEIIDKDVFNNMLFNRNPEVRKELYKTFSFPDLIRDAWHSLIHYYDNVYRLWRDA
ncbi:MAG: hypothetical protein ABH883_06925, partial [Candidatus Omnitrophota bacterium]